MNKISIDYRAVGLYIKVGFLFLLVCVGICFLTGVLAPHNSTSHWTQCLLWPMVPGGFVSVFLGLRGIVAGCAWCLSGCIGYGIIAACAVRFCKYVINYLFPKQKAE